jgi:hypothetical protein
MSQCFYEIFGFISYKCNYKQGKVVRIVLVILTNNVLHVIQMSLEQLFAFSHPFDLVRQL